ncbi:hypothetical protein [Paraburkholderia fungorum]|jgi:hypothetical protein|uniref:hypothetical protein n=1 Tax=Paraburkholderia fungorum TaxID=134537 RepID=UPI000D04EEAE|nr:hypothetical protein [Paraburkholderia fungorum]PRZ45376.1 hypothetical protein BX589_13955 [Paraburkholderia fungorum]
MANKTNKDYQFIINHGFTIDITSQDSGWARMYLVKNGKRITYVSFLSNNQNAGNITNRAPFVRPSTHLGSALFELKAIAMKHIEKNGVVIMDSRANLSDDINYVLKLDGVSVQDLVKALQSLDSSK